LAVACPILHGVIKLWAAAEIEPPNLVAFLHVIIDATKDPNAPVPDPAGVVIPGNKSPCPRPGPCLEIEVADVVQHTIVPSLTTANIQFVVVYDGGMASAAARYGSVQFGLRPVGGLEVEHDDIGEMLAMLILSTEDEKLATLPKTGGVA
jgi:hypothetical protein